MLKELRTQHRTIIQMSFQGFKNNEIAEKLEITPPTVSQIIRSPLGQAYMNGLQDRAQEDTLDVRKKLITLNSQALNTLSSLLSPRGKAPHAVQLGAAKDVLDRNGYKAKDNINIDLNLSTKSDDEIDAEINAMEDSINRNQLIVQSDENKQSDDQLVDSINDSHNILTQTIIPTTLKVASTLAERNGGKSDFDSDSNSDDFDPLAGLPLDVLQSSGKS